MERYIMTLYSRTLYLLENRPVSLTYEEIANDTGITCPWLKKFISGAIQNPSVKRIEVLHTYLCDTIKGIYDETK